MTTGQDTEASKPPLKVVVIESDPDLRLLLAKALEQQGHVVVAYENALVAPIGSSHCPCGNLPNCPDVIISDLDLPGMSGTAFIERLSHQQCRCRNIALVTGSGIDPDSMQKMYRCNARVFLKPFRLAELANWFQTCQQTRPP